MCSSDYSAPFDYVDRIIIDYAHDLCKGISSHVISLLKTHPKKENLHNHLFMSYWDEICVQLQTEPKIVWGLYDSYINKIIRMKIMRLPEYAFAAIEFSIDFAYYEEKNDCVIEECENKYDFILDAIIDTIKLDYIYSIAALERNQQIKDIIENERLNPPCY